MYGMLRRKAEGLREEVVEFARGLVTVPSRTGHEDRVADMIEEWMRGLAWKNVFRDEYGNVVSVSPGRSASPVLLLTSHMDNVASDLGAWTVPPHEGRIIDNILYGAGAADCKGGIAAQVFACELLNRSLLPMDGTVVFAATTAEEGGSSAGLRGLLKDTLPSMEIRPDYAVLGEPTNLGLYRGHDGWARFEITVQGTSPFEVDDATRAVAKTINPRFGEQSGFPRVDGPRFRSGIGATTGRLQIDRRILASEDVEFVQEEICQRAQSAADVIGNTAVAVSIPMTRSRLYTKRTVVSRKMIHAWETDPYNPVLERSRHALAAAGCTVRPGKWHLPRRNMATAGGVLLKEFSIPVAGYGPGDETKAHAPDECVELANLVEAMYGTAVIAHSLAGVPVWGWSSDEI